MPNDATLLHRFLHWEAAQPDAIQFTQPIARGQVVHYSWSDVGDEVRSMAAHLQSLNLPPRSQIAILGKNSAHWIMADLAIWMAGHVSVPLYPTANAETVAYVLEHSEAKLLFLGKLDEFWPVVRPGIPPALPVIRLPLAPTGTEAAPGTDSNLSPEGSWTDITAATAPLSEPMLPAADQLATIIYTSGSTGRPKGVMISFGAMMATARGLEQMYPITPADRMLSYLPLAHAAERAIVETPSLYFGLRVYFAWSLESFLEDLRRARPTLFFSVPRLWTKFYLGVCEKLPLAKQRVLFRIPFVAQRVKRRILEQLGLEHVRAAITGSAPLAPGLIAWYRSIGLELLEGYAMSENFAYSHGNVPGNTRVGYVGAANPGVEHHIADNGEVLVKSPGQMMGYYKLPELSAECMTPDGFFHTGDMGELDEKGRLKITGRVKELFKTSKGKYVAPVPIENRLGDHPKIEAVCVAGSGEPDAFALVMLSAEGRAEAGNGARERLSQELRALHERVNAELEPHERLGFVVVVKDSWTMENGFLTPTMKIRRNMIESRYQPRVEAWRAAGSPVVWE